VKSVPPVFRKIQWYHHGMTSLGRVVLIAKCALVGTFLLPCSRHLHLIRKTLSEILSILPYTHHFTYLAFTPSYRHRRTLMAGFAANHCASADIPHPGIVPTILFSSSCTLSFQATRGPGMERVFQDKAMRWFSSYQLYAPYFGFTLSGRPTLFKKGS